MSPASERAGLATAAADLAERSGPRCSTLFGSPFHSDVGLYPIRTLLEQRCGIERTTEQAERLRLLDEQRAGTRVGAGILSPAAGTGVGYFRRSRLRTRS